MIAVLTETVLGVASVHVVSDLMAESNIDMILLGIICSEIPCCYFHAKAEAVMHTNFRNKTCL